MPISHLNDQYFSDQEKDEITNLINQLVQLLEDKLVNLSPEERQKYGRIHEQNKLFVNKVWDYRTKRPELSSPDIDWEKFEQYYQNRQFLEFTVSELQSLVTVTSNAKILQDRDNYQDALNDYSYAKYKFGTSAIRYEEKVKDLKQFFNRSATSNGASKTSSDTEDNTES